MKKRFLYKYLFVTVLISVCPMMEIIAQQQRLKVLSYNVLVGFQNDSTVKDRYINWVKRLDPDIVAYQEMSRFNQKELEAFARRYSHPYASTASREGWCCPVALTSKFPLVNIRKGIDNMWHSFLYALVNDIHVFVIHYSPHSWRKRDEEVRNVLAHAAQLPPDAKIMIMGDFNALSESDAAMYSAESLLQRRSSDGGLEELRGGQVPDYFSVTNAVEEAGFKDAFKLLHSEFKKSIPTAKRGRRAGSGSRIDFIFISPALAKSIKSADIIHDEDTDAISDHYPVYVELELK